MRYLQPALYAEGTTDERFLPNVLWRLCDDLCLEFQQRVEVAPVEVLSPLKLNQSGSGSRQERIVSAATAASDLWTVLFIHADADGDEGAARAERVEPAMNVLMERFPERAIVAVVPVCMTEAWMLQDGEALRRVLGCTLSDRDWGLPSSDAGVEGLREPKQVLEQIFLSTRPSRSVRRQGIGWLYAPLGEQVRLERLRLLPSFRQTDGAVRAALENHWR